MTKINVEPKKLQEYVPEELQEYVPEELQEYAKRYFPEKYQELEFLINYLHVINNLHRNVVDKLSRKILELETSVNETGAYLDVHKNKLETAQKSEQRRLQLVAEDLGVDEAEVGAILIQAKIEMIPYEKEAEILQLLSKVRDSFSNDLGINGIRSIISTEYRRLDLDTLSEDDFIKCIYFITIQDSPISYLSATINDWTDRLERQKQSILEYKSLIRENDKEYLHSREFLVNKIKLVLVGLRREFLVDKEYIQVEKLTELESVVLVHGFRWGVKVMLSLIEKGKFLGTEFTSTSAIREGDVNSTYSPVGVIISDGQIVESFAKSAGTTYNQHLKPEFDEWRNQRIKTRIQRSIKERQLGAVNEQRVQGISSISGFFVNIDDVSRRVVDTSYSSSNDNELKLLEEGSKKFGIPIYILEAGNFYLAEWEEATQELRKVGNAIDLKQVVSQKFNIRRD